MPLFGMKKSAKSGLSWQVLCGLYFTLFQCQTTIFSISLNKFSEILPALLYLLKLAHWHWESTKLRVADRANWKSKQINQISGPSLGFEICGCWFTSLSEKYPVFTKNKGLKMNIPQNLWVLMQSLKKSVGAEHPQHPH